MKDQVKFRRLNIDSLESGVTSNEMSPRDTLTSNSKSKVNTVMVLILTVIWYSVAIFAITSSKLVMNKKRMPFTLCCGQFISATIITFFVLRFRNNVNNHTQSSYSLHIFQSYSNVKIKNMFMNLIYPIAISYTFGFIFTNISFSLAPPSFAETIKAGEPISSVILGYFYFNEGTSFYTYLTLVPICIGVGISCIDHTIFHFLAFITAAISNLCFSSRAVISKQLFSKYPNMVDEFQLFAYISQIGVIILLPLTLVMEGSLLYELFTSDGSFLLSFFSLLFLNGMAYSIYNLTSFLVLSRTDLVTHAVLNVFRRVFIIVSTSWYFHIQLSVLNSTGVFVAVIGVLLFAYTKHQEKLRNNTHNHSILTSNDSVHLQTSSADPTR